MTDGKLSRREHTLPPPMSLEDFLSGTIAAARSATIDAPIPIDEEADWIAEPSAMPTQTPAELWLADPIPAWRPPCHQPAPKRRSGGKKQTERPLKPEDVIRARRDRIEQKRGICSFLIKLAVICLCVWALLTQVFGFAAMKGEGMYPRIRDGDLMLYYRLNDAYAIGDVVTFTRGGARYTGRIVAKGGDTVNIDDTGQLYVNKNSQSEEIFYPTMATDNAGIAFPLMVPDNGLFLLCDMRTNATDSRDYGTVALDEVDGKVITILRRRGI